jgi:hypothetical protein
MTAVFKKVSRLFGSRFETQPPPTVQIEGDIVNLSDRLRLSMSCVAHSTRTRGASLSPSATAVLNPADDFRRANFPPLAITRRSLDYKTFSLKLCLNLDPPPGGTTSDDVSFISPPVAIFGKRDNPGIVPDIRSNSTVALFLRKPTPSPLVKYMRALDGKIYASTSEWSIFRISVLPETDDVISYGSTIVLTDNDTDTRFGPYVVYEAKNGTFNPGDGPVKELQSLAFRKLESYGRFADLAMSAEVGDESDFMSPVCDEVPTNSTAGKKKGSLYSRASWSIVSVSMFSCTFFDLLRRIPSVGRLYPIVTPFPVILNNPKLDITYNVIDADISNYFYTDRETGKKTCLEVWVGTAGPLLTGKIAMLKGNQGCLLPKTPRLTHSPTQPSQCQELLIRRP